MPNAVVIGAQGVIGRYIVEKLAALPDWNVTGLSRRRGTDAARVKHVPVDLLDAADAQAKLSGLHEVTHVFFAAFQPGSGPAADYAKNIAAVAPYSGAMLEMVARSPSVRRAAPSP